MSKFMLLYQSDAQAENLMAEASPEEMQASMAEWMTWRENAGGEDKVEFGLPLQPRKHFENGHASDSASEASGYSIVTADSLDEVMELIKNHPHLKRAGASIEVMELLKMPGM